MTEFYGELFSLAIKVVYAIISIVLTTIVAPWLKETVIPWLKEKRLYNIVKCFVQAAEKMGESGQIPKSQKKLFVVNLLKDKGITLTDEIDAMIESAVEELDNMLSTTVDMFYDDECSEDCSNDTCTEE